MAPNRQYDVFRKQINDVFKRDGEIKKDLDKEYEKLTETPDINSITWWKKLIDHAENTIIALQKLNEHYDMFKTAFDTIKHEKNQIYKKRSISNVIDLCKDEDDDAIVQPSKRQKTTVEDTPTSRRDPNHRGDPNRRGDPNHRGDPKRCV